MKEDKNLYQKLVSKVTLHFVLRPFIEKTNSDLSLSNLGCGDLLRRLPPQVVRKIIGYLDPHTLASALQVSKFWNEMFSSEWIWKRLCYLPRWRLSPKENRNQISRVLLQHGRLEVGSGRYGHQCFWANRALLRQTRTPSGFALDQAWSLDIFRQPKGSRFAGIVRLFLENFLQFWKKNHEFLEICNFFQYCLMFKIVIK